eukprot:CAMPEP_0177716764 /NCGR_PEP_ID=MMETSP0484_2-20121128/14677_1 /TAXON_ID=354590 /ORGANISM="Rhodomonas lens, Strain RHODO" /LENGTH=274 /DNA_ID=CAMNT_0019228803 /DNA_START=253 /DNA_END=1078 /DNA_ORIENTATION=+
MGGEISKGMCCDCDYQQRSEIVAVGDIHGASSLKLNENNQRFLRTMAEAGKAEMILVHNKNFDVNATDEAGDTALHKAAQNGHLIVCHILWKHGATNGVRNKAGNTPMQVAMQNHHQSCVDFLRDPESMVSVHRASAPTNHVEQLRGARPGPNGSADDNGNQGIPGPEHERALYGLDQNSLARNQQTSVGQPSPVTAMYNYEASPELPFKPDKRMEMDLTQGEKFMMLYRRPEDGWCLVYRASDPARVEGWAPGNFITSDGRTPVVASEGGQLY